MENYLNIICKPQFMEFYEIKDGVSIIFLNPSLYPIDVIYGAAYSLIEDAFFLFDGDPDIEVSVNISLKKDLEPSLASKELERISKEFYNNLLIENCNRINSSTKELARGLLLRKSFSEINLETVDNSNTDANKSESNETGAKSCESAVVEKNNNLIKTDNNSNLSEDLDDDFEFDDPEDIATPWEEKYGKESSD